MRVEVRPRPVPEHSDPAKPIYVFAYMIRITHDVGPSDSARDEGSAEGRLTLRRRCWRIIDASGREHEVKGEGVVGEQPTLGPGESYVYESFCPLATRWGTMEGWYELEDAHGTVHRALVGRFFLVFSG